MRTRQKEQRIRLLRKMLQERINELMDLAKTIAPDAEVTVLEPYEDEDAVVEVKVPAEKVDEVDEALMKRSTQIWLEEGFDIVPMVFAKTNKEG
ncbi:hypothetical protein [Fervidibacter sacchari]|jgi:hypothetical protein|uniref:Uncharacterized protein YutE (UPF0331/DUF86 family) n=1 Tax=Candidatus Fervidibacter sacchari TaxID=1448929 RepID=A0ABT2EP82_9BACT|nr:hypothetical protein [Candidatus Fervidibacter sacchari]MCS3919742.1 uncharacterized protein YutE (UPF0331/DUF86 family) [Candidatus Fervidibacter sacchari]WKU17010.1 hypothetical protein Q2T83_04125 [Candidatus Fervidibacter sacchari]